MGYHKLAIEKGELGEFSKIKEEFYELSDALLQKDKVLQICELTDLIEAIEFFSEKQFGLTLQDLIVFSNKTKLAFKEKKELSAEKADKRIQELYTEFEGLFNTYNIFSPQFKGMCLNLFHTVCFYTKPKKK